MHLISVSQREKSRKPFPTCYRMDHELINRNPSFSDRIGNKIQLLLSLPQCHRLGGVGKEGSPAFTELSVVPQQKQEGVGELEISKLVSHKICELERRDRKWLFS